MVSIKSINILSLVESYKILEQSLYKDFLNFYKINIKDDEIKDLYSLIEKMIKVKKKIDLLSNYFVGYEIPQIGKEFDLLRFGKNYIVNIEIKSQSTEEKVLKQLKLNNYYLGFLKKPLYCFSYIANENKLYYLDNSKLSEVDFNFLVKKLRKQRILKIENIDTLFDPTNYLVSPFNTTKKFIKGKYFLTLQQEEFKNKILKIIDDKTQANFIAITGSAGTGKTLLTYDITNIVMNSGKKVLLIHCGILNDGQEKLKDKYGWQIIPVKSYSTITISDYDLITLDEVQRIYPNQLTKIIDTIQENKGNCIFSYDKAQTLRAWEEQNDIDSKITSLPNIQKYKLSEKIRTNKEMANFIKMLFDANRNDLKAQKGNIEISFLRNIKASKAFQKQLEEEGWEVLKFTPSRDTPYYQKYYNIESKNSHKVIGQEFDKVAVFIDDKFFYNEDGKLQYKGRAYYHPVKMLFQNLTRARKKLHLIIINNQEVLDRCLVILNEDR